MLRERYRQFFPKEDYFFCIEVFETVLRGTLVSVEPDAKKVTVLKTHTIQISAEPVGVFTEALPALLALFRLPAAVQVLALLDWRRATVMSSAIELVRSDSQAEITQAELENLILRGVWKRAARDRAAAAMKMGISESRVTLADADVLSVRLDNHRVVNPIGFRARSVELCCRETFVDEMLVKSLEVALTDDNLAGVVEAPALVAGLIARSQPRSEFLLVQVGEQESAVYHVKEMLCLFQDSFGWGGAALLTGVAQQFGVAADTALDVLRRYISNEVSAPMRLAVERAASGELAILSNGIAAHQPHDYVLPVYLISALPLPETLFDPAFTHRLGINLSLTSVNDRFIADRTGFGILVPQTSSYSFTAALAAVSDVYVATATPILTKTAKRRARWGNSKTQAPNPK